MHTTAGRTDPIVDLSDSTLWQDEEAVRKAFAALRESQPVSWQPEWHSEGVEPGPGYWAVVRHEDVQHVSTNPALFSSASGTSLRTFPDELNARMGSMMNMDDPRHARTRRIVSHAFSARRVAELRGHIGTVARECVAALRADGGGDLVTSIAAHLPLTIICDLMGVPGDMRLDILGEVMTIGLSRDARVMQAAADSLHSRAMRLADQRRSAPGDDLLSALVHAEVDGETLSADEIGSFFILLATAGTGTVAQVIATAAVALHEHPDQRSDWVNDRSLTPTAVEELIRWTTPTRYFRRTATRQTTLHDITIDEGDKVVIWYASANQDPAVFDRPEQLDLRRHPNPHLAFGAGPHFCLGAQLARQELTAVLTALLDAAPSFTVTDTVPLGSSFAAGYLSVTVEM